MIKKYSLFFIISLYSGSLMSQEADSLRKGIHQTENDFYHSVLRPETEVKSAGYPVDLLVTEGKLSGKIVFGWHPYWASPTSYLNYNYEILTHIGWFSYEVDTATGGYTSIHDWNSTPVIDFAHQRGTKVILTVTNFGTSKNTEILTDTFKQEFLISTLISLIKSRNGDGVNFDFESISSSQRQNLVNFIEKAVTMIKTELPEAEVSITVPAVDWNNSFNLKELSATCDYIQVMTYDYYWSSSSTAGPVAPVSGETYNVTRTINTYLTTGLLKEKFLLGIPWYGYDWPVVNSLRKSAATGKATAKTFSSARQLANSYSARFDETTGVPWLSYLNSSAWRQMWFEDSVSLSYKYKLARSMDLAGVGIWALSYEGVYNDVWNTMKRVLSDSQTDGNRITSIFPNPVRGEAEIQFVLARKSEATLIIYDLLGKEMIVLFKTELESGLHTCRLGSETLGQGIYICVLITGKDINTGKIIITK